jgi:catechol 2,3-dioxygenase-like lactoylglutathione lyase family enzyme
LPGAVISASVGSMPVERPIDHLVLCVRDLDAARRAYERLGFTLTPKALHPFGTANSLVQLQGNFLELLAIADRRLIKPAGKGEFAFAAFNERFLAEREGMSMLVFASDDARRDQREFAAAGLDTYAPFDFSRQAVLPDGSAVTVGFSLAFATETRMPDAAFFVCQQHAPQYFWKPEYQRHRNGAIAVDEVVMVAPDPAVFASFFAKLQPGGAVERRETGLAVTIGRGMLTVLDPAGFAARFPQAGAAIPRTPHFAAYRMRVADLPATEALLRANGIAISRQGTRIQLGPAETFGVVLEFAASEG